MEGVSPRRDLEDSGRRVSRFPVGFANDFNVGCRCFPLREKVTDMEA